jgi:DNA-directed RNA polymerase subunit RPC12/RpoP
MSKQYICVRCLDKQSLNEMRKVKGGELKMCRNCKSKVFYN